MDCVAEGNMEVQVYVDFFSQPSRAVLAFCIEAGIPHVVKEVRLAKNEQNSEEFLKISPWGTVPAIVHKGLAISESHAILTYLADEFKKNDPWYPVDQAERIKVNTYLHWHHFGVRFPFATYIFNKFMGPRFYNRKENPEINRQLEVDQLVTLEYLDSILKTSYAAGTKQITIADLSLYCELIQGLIIKLDYSSYPNVSNWLNKMETLRGIQESHKVFHKLLPRIKL
jgi:glutathione S-transferase